MRLWHLFIKYCLYNKLLFLIFLDQLETKFGYLLSREVNYYIIVDLNSYYSFYFFKFINVLQSYISYYLYIYKLFQNSLDEPSIDGHLQCKSLKTNRLPVIQGTNGFDVESVSSHAIQVKHPICASVTLLSAYRIFKDVHNKSVSIGIIYIPIT